MYMHGIAHTVADLISENPIYSEQGNRCINKTEGSEIHKIIKLLAP